jgi:hypothetical protein
LCPNSTVVTYPAPNCKIDGSNPSPTIDIRGEKMIKTYSYGRFSTLVGFCPQNTLAYFELASLLAEGSLIRLTAS